MLDLQLHVGNVRNVVICHVQMIKIHNQNQHENEDEDRDRILNEIK